MADGGVKRDPNDEKHALLSRVEQREQTLQKLQHELDNIQRVLSLLESKKHQVELLGDVYGSIEKLDKAGGSQLLWKDQGAAEVLKTARRQIDEHRQAVERAGRKRDELLARIGEHGHDLDFLRLALDEAREREAQRANHWVVEREADEIPHPDEVMPWTRRSPEDRRYRWALVFTVIVTGALAYAVSLVSIPVAERPKQIQLPERMARLVREERKPPPPPPVEEPVEEEEIPEPEPEPDEEETPAEVPEVVEETQVAVLSEKEVKEKVKTQGILAFRESFARRATLDATAQLGSQARVRAVDDDATNRPQRSLVTTNAPGLGAGIDLGEISRGGVGGGSGGGVATVEVARVASTIDTAGALERPQADTALGGRTDEDIQIVFDRYKSSLYRLYNRELRKDPRLRGQVVLRLTIEPDGSVSSCELQSSNMNATELVRQVIDRVLAFDFGAREDISSVTIIYPIDFMPGN